MLLPYCLLSKTAEILRASDLLTLKLTCSCLKKNSKKIVKCFKKLWKKIVMTYTCFLTTCQVLWWNYMCGAPYGKKQNQCSRKNVLKFYFGHWFVFFAECTTHIVSWQNLARIYKTCICLSPNFPELFVSFYYSFRFFLFG